MTAPDVEDILEATPLQHGMLFHSLAEPDARLYFEQVCLFLPLQIDLPAFQRAWHSVVERHQALRTGFHWARLDKPVQVVRRQARLHIHLEDWAGCTPAEQMQRLQAYLQADRAQGLDLQHAPLMHVALFRLGHAAHEFVTSFHHAILDGWSLNLVFAEFLALYHAALGAPQPALAPPVPFARYIAWLRQQDQAGAQHYWREVLAGCSGTSGWQPQAEAAPPPQGQRSFGSAQRRLGLATTQALEALARRARATLNAVLQAGWAVLLARHAQASDVVFGAIVSGRPADLDGVEQIVGLFINTVPVRARCGPDCSVLELVQALHAQGLATRQFSHSALPEVLRCSGLAPERPLFDSLFIFENLPHAGKGGPSLQATAIERTNYPCTLVVAPGREIALKLLYTTPPLTAAVVERLLAQYAQLLEAMAGAPERDVLTLPWLPHAQREQLLAHSVAPALPAQRLELLWARQLAAAPQRVLVIDGERQCSAAQLQTGAARLARAIAAADPGGGTAVVALLLTPSAELVAAMLGVLMAGRAFLLLDPAYPAERLRWMLDDAGAALLVADPALAAALDLPGRPRHLHVTLEPDVLAGDAAPVSALQHDGPAYVIYTSGSTGRPKGVLQTHGATLQRFGWMWRQLPFDAQSLSCHRTALGFVDVVWEILGPVLASTPLLIVPQAARRDALAMARLLARWHVSRLVLVPSLLRVLLELPPAERDGLACVREWICSGEALDTDLLARWQSCFGAARLWNLYGSSEVAGDVSWAEATQWQGGPLPIGQPMDGCELLLLDQALQPVPWGVVGEVFVGGPHLALGYLGQPGLTAARFVPHPHATQPGRRLYRTGDLARRLEDGALVYMGRADAQIKLHGMRIEPAEIEAALCSDAAVRQAVVLAQADRLVAVVELQPEVAWDAVAARARLAARLPAHLLPARFQRVQGWPLQPNGKVDRRALAAQLERQPVAPPPAQRVAPHGAMECTLAEIWQELLQLDAVSADDDFLALGGHSIAAMQLVSRVLKRTGIELPLRQVFERHSLREMAALLDEAAQSPLPAAPALVRVARESRRIPLQPGG